jgi:trimethylamine monooxygenase
MHISLWSLGPKEVDEYVDYPFEKHFGCSTPSYLPRAVLYDYITGRAATKDIRKFISFQTAVRFVDFNENKQEFQVTIEDLLTEKMTENVVFDHVIVASGHYTIPNMPDFEGLPNFPGRVLHSHDFRGADEFVGKNLLIIGGGYSAEDIAMQCSKFGAGSITITYRTCATGFKWPDNIKEVPLVQRIEGHTAHFEDGSSVDNIDCIILCTGYRHSHSFMAQKLRLYCPSDLYIPPELYKGIFWAAEPRLAYLGMQQQLYSFNMFDIQAALVRDVFLGYVKLPEDEEKTRREDISKWEERQKPLAVDDHEGFCDLQTDYIRDLINCCDQKTVPKFDLDLSTARLYKFLADKRKNISTYRDQSFCSIHPPYKESPKCKTPWMKNMADSKEEYLSSIQNGEEKK